jgi:glycosyltransferase involved in cell wall biosynthesis
MDRMSSGNKLRIMQVAPAMEGGGGEQIALRMHQALRSRGHRSMLMIGRGVGAPDQDIFSIPDRWSVAAFPRLLHRTAALIARLTQGRGGRWFTAFAETLAYPRVPWDLWRGNEDFTQPGSRHLLALAPEKPDVVLLHNLHARWNRREGFFDLAYLVELSNRVPVLLFPQDPWLLTGHCAHPINCPRWRTGCGRCPDLAIYPSIRRDATAWNFRRKRDIYSQSRLFLAAPSQWLLDMFHAAGVPLAGGKVIANGVDSSAFAPGHKLDARRSLGLDAGRKIVLISANHLRTNPWKAYDWVYGTVSRLGEMADMPPTDFVVVGEEGAVIARGNVRLVFAGRGIPPVKMPAYYRAADIYFHPSRADTAPFSILEAMSCCLPVVATSVCGIPEQVADNQTGCLAAAGDIEALTAALHRLLLDPGLSEAMGKRGRERVLERFNFQVQLESMEAWIREILEPTQV